MLFSLAAFGFVTHFASASTTGILVPTYEGYYKEWKPSTGSTHYTLVDETPCNSTDYNATTTIAKRDSYGISLSTVGNGAYISQIDIQPCASRQTTGTGTATSNVFYRYNGVDSSDAGNYALSGTTPVQLATTTFSSLNLFKTATSTLETGMIYSAGDKGARLSRIATKVTYTLSAPSAPSNLTASSVGSTQMNLGWTDNSTNETEFQIYRALNDGAYSKIATTT
ncbi:MAG: hypothetical protein LAO03_21520 [Acidobacteriia bacterium]|nr:hypothetical protein [Terriglobia bacterium]